MIEGRIAVAKGDLRTAIQGFEFYIQKNPRMEVVAKRELAILLAASKFSERSRDMIKSFLAGSSEDVVSSAYMALATGGRATGVDSSMTSGNTQCAKVLMPALEWSEQSRFPEVEAYKNGLRLLCEGGAGCGVCLEKVSSIKSRL